MSEEKKDATMPSNSSSSMPAKGGMKGMVVGLVAILVLAGVAVGLYQWSGGKSMTPEERTAAMGKKVSEMTSAAYTAKMDIALGETSASESTTALQAFGVEKEVTNVVLTAEGKMATAHDDEKALSSADITLAGKTANGEDAISVAMSFRMVEDLMYLQLHALPEKVKTSLNALGGLDISFLEDQWIELDMKALAEQLGVPTEELTKLQEQQLTKEELDQVRTAFVNNTFLQLTGEPVEEEVSGEKTLKYETTIDIPKLKAFLEEIKPILVARDIKEEDFNASLESLQADYDEMLSDTNLEVHTWVGKKDNNLYKMQVMLTPKQEADRKEISSVTMSLELSDHNGSVTVEKPEEAMTIQEVVGQLVLSAGGNQIQEEQKEQKKKN